MDDYDDSCAEYEAMPHWCGQYDNDNFISSEMCCVCGGGSTGNKTEEEGGLCFDTNHDTFGNVLADDWNDGCAAYAESPGWCG